MRLYPVKRLQCPRATTVPSPFVNHFAAKGPISVTAGGSNVPAIQKVGSGVRIPVDGVAAGA
jgi:hypothetical protein